MKVKNGDNVVVIAGANKGKTGQVIKTLPKQDKVVVGKVNMRKKHVKKTSEKPGSIIEFEAPIHVSNVSVVDPKSSKATRVGYKKLENGKKVRIAKKSGQELK